MYAKPFFFYVSFLLTNKGLILYQMLLGKTKQKTTTKNIHKATGFVRILKSVWCTTINNARNISRTFYFGGLPVHLMFFCFCLFGVFFFFLVFAKDFGRKI